MQTKKYRITITLDVLDENAAKASARAGALATRIEDDPLGGTVLRIDVMKT